MATVVLSAAGAAIGGQMGGTAAAMMIGRAVGATVGRVLDQKLLGQGSRSVETGRVDRFRLTQSGEGAAISQIHGRMRVGGQVIWASDFQETASSSTAGGGKGAPSGPKTTTTQYSYSVSLALALCEGEITSVSRVWADGEEVALESLNMRVHQGTRNQVPDSVIEAIEGTDNVPAYRGIAYVVFDGLELEQFGNRVPQFSFEVCRPEQPGAQDDMTRSIEAVAIIPGTGEYSLATTPVHYTDGPGSRWSANVHTPSGQSDFSRSLTALSEELPNTRAASLVVSWFGGDLRCEHCNIEPKIELRENEGENMPWNVAGFTRGMSEEVPKVDGNPVYGGTPTDTSVIEAIKALQASGKDVMFYPFILMDQLAGSGLPDPYGASEQVVLPWRGRITLDIAPGRSGSPDGTQEAADQVASFFGAARASDFFVADGQVIYSGPAEWSFSRFILHYAALCAAAGGVESFCIGSEMRGMTQVRGPGNSFPFVDRLCWLADEARALLGGSTMIGYAADWSEYFGYQPQDGSGDRFFHLDPLWAHPEIDFVGIDNYMPLSDWRDGDDNLDEASKSVYALDYLRGNIEGGEGFDWYYANQADRDAQVRTPIEDTVHGEPWIWRYKDLRNWWSQPHHERIDGVRQANPTDWEPQSKPIWFTELGCAAVDKGCNQPNKFVDPKSSESQLPHFSNGGRDECMQMQYIRAMTSYYADASVNPTSAVYGGPMVDLSRAFVWAWDARPFPYFPNNIKQWNDGDNYRRGHWLNGRTSGRPLASVVKEICDKAGVGATDTSELYGYVRGYSVAEVSSARAALQPLMLRYGFDAIERDGLLQFRMRDGQKSQPLAWESLARVDEIDGLTEQERDSDMDLSGRVHLQFVEADGDFDTLAEEAVLPQDQTHSVSSSEMPLSMTRGEGRQTAERWLAESRVARDRVRFALPPSRFAIGAGDVVDLEETGALYRIDRVEQGPVVMAEAVRIDGSVYQAADVVEEPAPSKTYQPAIPVTPLFLDLPLLRGDETPHAPHLATTAKRWPGSVAIYGATQDFGYELQTILPIGSTVGLTQTALPRMSPGLWDRGVGFQVKMIAGQLESAQEPSVLSGANLVAIGDGSPGNWELLQFANADLIAPDTYQLRNLLRGQKGTDALMPDIWSSGSWLVLINEALAQIDLGAHLRQVEQHFRIGPASRPIDDPSFVHVQETFDGNGLRPYSPVHLSAAKVGEDLTVSWIRRTREEGDNWSGEVPLGEETELYSLRIEGISGLLREVQTSTSAWTYSAAMQVADGASGPVNIDVAQISARYGPGPSAKLTFLL